MEAIKLYVVVRSDLPPGAQVAQACHALRLFVAAYPDIDQHWYRYSNNLVCLQVSDQAALQELTERLSSNGVPIAMFHEPDYGDELTAIAVAPAGARLLSNLPLALRSEARE